MKFVLSFSGGKDGILALHELVQAGYEPVALLVMYRPEEGRSWVHGLDERVLSDVADALGLPLILGEMENGDYARGMEAALRRAKALGAQACAFGDIDTPGHREWDEARCAAVGLEPLLPLWGRDREELVRRTLDLGYRCIIKCVQTGVLPEDWLGKPLTPALLEEIKVLGADPCGENGEYHTVVTDGPLFRRPVEVENRGIVRLEYNTVIDLTLKGETM